MLLFLGLFKNYLTFVFCLMLSDGKFIINPQNVNVGGSVTLFCSPENNVNVTVVVVGKKTETGNTTSVAAANVSANTVTLLDETLSQRADVFGTASQSRGEVYIKLVLTSVTCSDAGIYSCRVDGPNEINGSVSTETTATVTVISDLRSISKEILPDKTMLAYEKNDEITIRCSVPAANHDVLWSWQWRENCVWVSYPFTERIRQDPKSLSECGDVSVTTLTFSVTYEDDNRLFRCLVNDSLEYSADIAIPVMQETTVPTRIKVDEVCIALLVMNVFVFSFFVLVAVMIVSYYTTKIRRPNKN